VIWTLLRRLELLRVSLAIWDHTVLPAIHHKRTQASTQFTYPGGMEGWVDLREWLHRDGLPSHRWLFISKY